MHDKLTLSFFATFSRFEYALKAAGKVRAGIGGAAEANWQEVENAIRQADVQSAERIRSKAGILLTDPPRKQVVVDGQLHWQPAGPAGDEAQNLVASLKRVRNNVFHGGKYSPKAVLFSPRSALLIQCVDGLLQELLTLPALHDVSDYFHGMGGAEEG
jgi:hypothetical protein